MQNCITGGKSDHASELAAERARVAGMYRLLHREIADASARRDAALAAGPQTSAYQRDVDVRTWSDRATGLRAARTGLCFGRIDPLDGAPLYIGRVGLTGTGRNGGDDDGPGLVDWRAPVAEPFYRSTARNPSGMRRRRHLVERSGEIVEFHDEPLAEPAGGSVTGAEGSVTGGPAALLAALEAPRGSGMADIVATLQCEQDEIVRAPDAAMVVEGGPGTGKTAVALHRVAWLLYRHRERMARRGILVLGPTPQFCDHVRRVLPALGETGAVYATRGTLLPDLQTVRHDADAVARLKGAARMAGVLADAVAARQELPLTPIPIELDDVTIEVGDELVAPARERARAAAAPHNRARAVFRDALGAAVVDAAVARIGAGWLDPAQDRAIAADLAADVRHELRAHPSFHAAVQRCWPELDARRLLADLYTDPARREAVAPDLEPLARTEPDAWTVSDVALLDEATVLLDGDAPATAQPAAEDRAAAEYARGVLAVLDPDAHDPEVGAEPALLPDAAVLAERQADADRRSVADRAVADRAWVYGHVVVDEAQELSAMDWRMVARRCPSGSITVVGDPEQRSRATAVEEWSDALAPVVGQRWTHRMLTVNYRTPDPIARLAARLTGRTVPRSARPDGDPPWTREVPRDALVDTVVAAAADERDRVTPGSVAVVAPPPVYERLVGADLGAVSLLGPREAKGLEFDAVVVVEPAAFDDEADLFVALTRATRRLGIVRSRPLPSPR